MADNLEHLETEEWLLNKLRYYMYMFQGILFKYLIFR